MTVASSGGRARQDAAEVFDPEAGQEANVEVDTDCDRYDLHRTSPTAEIEAGR